MRNNVTNINSESYWTEQYSTNPDRHNNHDEVKDTFFANYIEDGKSVLDIGCGNGMFLSYVQRRCPESPLWGIDLASSAIAECMQMFPKGKFINGSIFETDFGKTFDYVVCMETLEHLEHPEEMARRIGELSHDMCLVTTPYKDHIPSAEHIQEFDYREIQEMFMPYFKHLWVFPMASGRLVRTGNVIKYPSGNMDTIVLIGKKL